jgi:uncharacterized protein (DUF1810 family)
VNSSFFALDRFIDAQSEHYEIALGELRRGLKQGHWIWYVLPQIRGLGRSSMSLRYGIVDRAEAEAYLAHPVLGVRLRECVTAICAHRGTKATEILGDIDAMKFRSCLTLFAAVDQDTQLFRQALKQFYGGKQDMRTIKLLASLGVS